MNRYVKRWIPILSGLLLYAAGYGFAQTGAGKAVNAAGAVQASNEAIHVLGTLGQPIVGLTITPSHQISQGFWFMGGTNSISSTNIVAGEILPTLLCTPNPVQGRATIHVTANATERVSLSVHDLLGREVRSLLRSERTNGSTTIPLDADQLPTGHYTIVLTTETSETTFPIRIIR